MGELSTATALKEWRPGEKLLTGKEEEQGDLEQERSGVEEESKETKMDEKLDGSYIIRLRLI